MAHWSTPATERAYTSTPASPFFARYPKACPEPIAFSQICSPQSSACLPTELSAGVAVCETPGQYQNSSGLCVLFLPRTNFTRTEGGANEARIAPDHRAGIWRTAERAALRGTIVHCDGSRRRAAERQEKQEQEGCTGRHHHTLDDERRAADRLSDFHHAGRLAGKRPGETAPGVCGRRSDRQRQLGSADHRLVKFCDDVPAAARAHATSAHGPVKYVHQGGGYVWMGLLSMGFRSQYRWPGLSRPGADHAGVREAEREVADRAQSHVTSASQRRADTGQAGKHSFSDAAATAL